MSGFISRGFGGRRRAPEGTEDRIPPGQYYEPGFPVLTAGPAPRVTTDAWTFSIEGKVGSEGGGGGRRSLPRRRGGRLLAARSTQDVVHPQAVGQ